MKPIEAANGKHKENTGRKTRPGVKRKSKDHQPSNAERMDPTSPYFSKDWWLTCEISPPDPWAWIVSDFQWSDEIISVALLRKTPYPDKEVGHFPENYSTKDQMEFGLNAVFKLKAKVESQISEKKLSAEFLRDWGEYQKAVAVLLCAAPQTKKLKGIRDEQIELSVEKLTARLWYVLWFDWYRANQKSKRRISRLLFDEWFEQVLFEIRRGKRTILKSVWKADLFRLIDRMSSDPKDKDHFQLTAFYSDRKFYGKEFTEARKRANEIIRIFPPVGLDFYPEK